MAESVHSESTPLLPSTVEPASYSPQGEPAWGEAAVCALSYTLATMFVFTPLRSLLGDNNSKHIVAMISVWFHPVRTRGNLVEVLYYSVLLILLCLLNCAVAAGILEVGRYFLWPQQLVSLILLFVLSIFLGLIGMLKVRTNDASYQTASSAAIIFLVAVMVGERSLEKGELPLHLVLMYLNMVLIGAAISSFVCLVVYRKASIIALKKKSAELALLVVEMLEILADNIGKPQNEKEWTEKYVVLDLYAQKLLLDMKEHVKYAPYGRYISKFLLRFTFRPEKYIAVRTDYNKTIHKVSSVQRQAMHLGGMRHCITVINQHLLQGSSEQSRQNALIRDLRKSIASVTFKLSNYVHMQQGDYYFDKPIGELSNELAQYTRDRDRILHSIVDLGGDNCLHATCVLFAHVLQDLSEEILYGNAGNVHSPAGEQTHLYAQQYAHGPTEYWTTPSSERDEIAAATLERLNAALHPKSQPSRATGIGPGIWTKLRVLRNQDVRYGIRVAIGSIILALPAFLHATSDTFHAWHGEWAVNIYMIIMARNMGGMWSNFKLRLIGSTLGASTGMFVSEICQHDPIAMAVLSCLMSLVCFRRLLSDNFPVFGRFVLLSYNLVCLYSYSMEVEYPDIKPPIFSTTFHRIIAVAAGVIWSVFVTSAILPHSTKRSLRYSLCIQWMRMGMTWKSDPLGIVPLEDYDSSNRVTQETGLRFRGIPTERELQNMMLGLNLLLAGSCDEINLRGQFDPKPYEQLLDATKIIMDAFHSFSTLIEDDPTSTNQERDLVDHTAIERQKLCQFLFLQFYTASTSIRLGFPLPEYLQAADAPIENFANKVKDRWLELQEHKHSKRLSHDYYDFVLFYSFLTVAYTVSEQLTRIHDGLEVVYGSLHDEALFL